jgi:hypothetical protein
VVRAPFGRGREWREIKVHEAPIGPGCILQVQNYQILLRQPVGCQHLQQDRVFTVSTNDLIAKYGYGVTYAVIAPSMGDDRHWRILNANGVCFTVLRTLKAGAWEGRDNSPRAN